MAPGHYTASSEVCDTTVNALRQRGRRNREGGVYQARRIGTIFNGTTHMMMLGTNNLEIADVILNWVDSALSSKPKHVTAKK